MDTAELFWSGRSQAVRLPKEFRFEGGAVRIRCEGKAVILEPIAQDWAWLDDNLGPFDQGMIDAIEEPVTWPEENQDAAAFFRE